MDADAFCLQVAALLVRLIFRKAWTSNSILINVWGIIAYSCPKFSGTLPNLRWRFDLTATEVMAWLITFQAKLGYVIICPCLTLGLFYKMRAQEAVGLHSLFYTCYDNVVVVVCMYTKCCFWYYHYHINYSICIGTYFCDSGNAGPCITKAICCCRNHFSQ